MKANKLKKIVAVAFAFCAATLCAGTPKNLTLTGSDSPAIWDIGSTAIWSDGRSTTTFANGDNVTINDTFTGASLMMNARVTPGEVLFDISKTVEFGWGANNAYGLGVDTGSFTKKGKGLLLLRSDLSGTAYNAGGDPRYGNGLTCGVEVVEGEIALKNRNAHNFLGPRTVPFWVHVHDGASLTFLDGNQSGTHTSTECGLCILLDEGAKLNHGTNAISTKVNSALCVNTLKLAGGDIVEGSQAYNDDANRLGGKVCMKIFNKLHFAGSQPHSFGYAGTYADCKEYTLADTLKGWPISLNSFAPVTFEVDDITNDELPDAYVKMKMFTYGTNSAGIFKSDIIKTGSGTLVIPDCEMQKKFYGNFTVSGGEVKFMAQGFFPSETEGPAQTLTVSNNATLNCAYRNIITGTVTERPNVKVVIDHGTFRFATQTGAHGCLRAREWVFNDPILDIRNAGLSQMAGVFGFFGPVTFRGTRPISIDPCSEFSDANQIVHVYNDPRTEFDVADLSKDGETDVTIGMKIYNCATGSVASCFIEDCGFVKRGAGTLAVTHKGNLVSGDVTVSEGTLRVDGVLSTPRVIEVEAGGCLGGTGTVAKVSLASGAGFEVRPTDKGNLLTIEGDLGLPSSGVIVMPESGSVKSMKFATVTGALSGAVDLSGWKLVRPDGTVVKTSGALWAKGNILCAGERQGMVMIFR